MSRGLRRGSATRAGLLLLAAGLLLLAIAAVGRERPAPSLAPAQPLAAAPTPAHRPTESKRARHPGPPSFDPDAPRALVGQRTLEPGPARRHHELGVPLGIDPDHKTQDGRVTFTFDEAQFRYVELKTTLHREDEPLEDGRIRGLWQPDPSDPPLDREDGAPSYRSVALSLPEHQLQGQPDGLYALRLDIRAQRVLPSSTLHTTIHEHEWFRYRIDQGVLVRLDEREYTAIVDPVVTEVDEDGVTHRYTVGHAVDLPTQDGLEPDPSRDGLRLEGTPEPLRPEDITEEDES